MAHPPLTERQRDVLAAVCEAGDAKGASPRLGIAPKSIHRRIEYARSRCGCPTTLGMVFRHRHELDQTA